MEIREIIDLFKDSKYKEAEKELKKKLNEENEEKEYSKIYYMLGIIELEKNKENSKEIAKNYIEESLNYKPVFKLSYYEYDKLEKRDNNIAVGFLRRGLEEFPNDIELYNRLFRRENDKEKYNIINEVIEKEIVAIDLYNLFIEYAFEKKLFDLVGKIIDKLKKIVKHGFMNNEYLLLEISCDILKDMEIKNIEDKIKIVQQIIKEDIKNEFKYWSYLILIYLEYIKGNISDIKEILDKIEITVQLEDMYSWKEGLDINLYSLYIKIFDSLEKNLKDEYLAKIRILKFNYINYKINCGEDISYKSKEVKNLVNSLKFFENEEKVYLLVFNVYVNTKKYFEAFDFAINNYLKNSTAKRFFSKKKFALYLKEMKEEDLIKVVNKLIIIKDNIDNYDITVYDIAKDFIDEIIEELHDREMFDYVYRLIKDIKLYILEEMKNKFEIAYSHKDKYIAKKLYENLLNKNPDNSAYNNNIGVIYKEEGNLFKAKEFFEKACMIDPEDKISSNNLQDVNKNIEELYDAYEKVQNENVWILSKLMLLYEEVVDGIVTCSYKEQSKVLQVSAEKAQELFENFVKNGYIVKVKTNDEWGRNQYRINSLIRDYLNERKEYLEENKEYEDIASNINIESLREIGYTKELIEKIEGINDKDFADILLRDFKECAIAVTGKQNKTAIILSGSMAETLLNYKVQEKGIKRYKLLIDGEEKNIRVKDMGLAELLEVAKKENIIHQTDYHLTQVVRNYRNLIHPSVELRKSMHISEQEATLIWGILKKVIKDIL